MLDLSSSAGIWIGFSGSLLASLAGSAHCAGMCGGLVGLGIGKGASSKMQSLLLQGARVATYVLLGAGAGAVGQELFQLGIFPWLHRLALASWAVVIFWMAIRMARGEAALHLGTFWPFGWPSGFAPAVFRVAARAGRLRSLGLGVGMAFLPCAWLHGFLMTAALSGSPVLGALTMFAFGLGTLPALLGVSLLAQFRPGFFPFFSRALGPRGLASLWVAFGLVSLGLQAGWISLPGHSHSAGHGTGHSPSHSAAQAPSQTPAQQVPGSHDAAQAHPHSHH